MNANRKILPPSVYFLAMLSQVFTSGGHSELTMFNPSGAYQPISNLLYLAPFPSDNNYFQAVMLVDVDVH